MKKLPLMLMLVTGAAFSQTAYVTPPGSNKVGDTIQKENFIYVLFTSKPCSLPLVNAEHMRKAELYGTKDPDIGCWARTLSPSKGSILIIGPEGNVSNQDLMGFAKATIKAGGDAVIDAPAYFRPQP